MVTAREVEEELTGEDALTDLEEAQFSRALQKGYGEPYDAYRVGVRDGAEAALKAVAAEADRERNLDG